MDPNTLNLYPGPGFWPNLDPGLDPGLNAIIVENKGKLFFKIISKK